VFADSPVPPEYIAKRKAIESHITGLCETFGDDALSEIFKALEENITDRLYVRIVVDMFWSGAYNPTTAGDTEILKIMRKIIDAYNGEPPHGAGGAITYIVRKPNGLRRNRLTSYEGT